MITAAIIAFFAFLGTLAAKIYKFGPFLEDEKEALDGPVSLKIDPGEELVKESTQVAPPLAPPSQKSDKATLTNLCLAIKEMEGANPANNNPGNAKFYEGGYLPMYGEVKRSPGGFAMFPTYTQGWMYLQNLVKSMIKAHPNRTLLQFFEVYAPKEDGNDPVHYSQFVAARMGVDNRFRVGDTVLV